MQNDDRPLVVSAKGVPLQIYGLAKGTTLLCRGAVDVDGGPVAVSELDRMLRERRDLESLGAPYAAILVDKQHATVSADHVGFRHVYGAQQPGLAMVGTSARRIAARIRTGINYEALAVQRIVGHHLDDDTPYAGVRKLAAGHLWRLAEGSLREEAFPDLPDRPYTPELVAIHAARLRKLICGFLDQHDNVVLELSGGMDSRLILAAIPPERRREVTAFTIVHRDSADGPVSRRIAALYGMTLIEADLDGVADFDPAQAYAMAHEAALKQDGMGAPLSAAVFEWAERDVATEPRLSGHGGELARVGYYLLQPNRPKQTPELADRFFNMWFANNYGVPDGNLDANWAAESREIGFRRVRQTFAASDDVDWMRAMDNFFLRQRLQRWGGATITNGVEQRVTLNPLLDREVLAIMMSLPHRRRWSSKQAVEVLAHLDPELASLPLASGMRPTALRRPSALTRVIGETQVTKFAGRATRKVMRLRRGVRRYAAGAPVMAELVAEHWRQNPDLVEPIERSGLVNQTWLAKLMAGAAEAEAATVDFMLNLSVLLGAI